MHHKISHFNHLNAQSSSTKHIRHVVQPLLIFISKIFSSPPTATPKPWSNDVSFSPFLARGHPCFTFYLYKFDFLGPAYKWNHIFVFLCLAYFTWCFQGLSVLQHMTEPHSFHDWIIFHCMERSHCVCPLMHWQTAGGFCFLANHIHLFISLLWTTLWDRESKAGFCSFSLWILTPSCGFLFSWTLSAPLLLRRAPRKWAGPRRNTVSGLQWKPAPYQNCACLTGLCLWSHLTRCRLWHQV